MHLLSMLSINVSYCYFYIALSVALLLELSSVIISFLILLLLYLNFLPVLMDYDVGVSSQTLPYAYNIPTISFPRDQLQSRRHQSFVSTQTASFQIIHHRNCWHQRFLPAVKDDPKLGGMPSQSFRSIHHFRLVGWKVWKQQVKQPQVKY